MSKELNSLFPHGFFVRGNSSQSHRRSGLIVKTLLFGVTLAPASWASLLLNPGFESPAVPAGTFTQVNAGGSIGAWTVTGANVLHMESTYVDGNGVFTPQEGTQSLDLNGFGATASGVSQTVATLNGQLYELDFYLGDKETAFTTGPARLEVFVDGISQGIFQHLTNSAVTSWSLRTLTFTATGVSTIIELRALADAGNNFVGLDNVTLQSIPEPATWTLLGSALAGLIWRRVRR